jgi:hypothetical protein
VSAAVEIEVIQAAADQLLNELESSRLEVVLVPQKRRTNEGGCIRVCANKNATWYQRFCAQFISSREVRRGKLDTRIKRRNTERVLRAIAEGQTPASVYFDRLLPFLTQRARTLSANPF